MTKTAIGEVSRVDAFCLSYIATRSIHMVGRPTQPKAPTAVVGCPNCTPSVVTNCMFVSLVFTFEDSLSTTSTRSVLIEPITCKVTKVVSTNYL